jgi:uncharacterized membrane protein
VTGIVAVVLAGALLGPALVLFPLRWLQVAAGLVLIYFGWKWSKKSVIRQAAGKRAGWIENPLRGIVGASTLLFVFAFELDRNPAGTATASPEDNI